MCGIIGATTSARNTTPILLAGLERLEYRGYDSAGLALLTAPRQLTRVRAAGKVAALHTALGQHPPEGRLGIAHTRWATHGVPAEHNAHPHISDGLALVHNGIIENHDALRRRLQHEGFVFTSDTDTEVIAHLIALHGRHSPDRTTAFREALQDLHGAYAIALIHEDDPDTLHCARMGSPLVIGIGEGEHFVASDPLALSSVTDQFIYLEEGDVARLTPGDRYIWRACGAPASHPVQRYEYADHSLDKGDYRHYMLKEIHEQPQAIADTLEGTLSDDRVLTAILGPDAEQALPKVRNIHIVACGTSYHAGQVARYWIEEHAGIPCQVEVASEYRYRRVMVPEGTLLVTISQSGETADTLAALRHARKTDSLNTLLGSLAICNVPGSSLTREADWRLLTRAGPEIGVASTKAFTTQLTALLWLTCALMQTRPDAAARSPAPLVQALRSLPQAVANTLTLAPQIEALAARFADTRHALFLGRGAHYPIAMEGALKLKEISYIHAEAYAAGELKHGPLALVDNTMPVISVAPSDALLDKLKSNLQEVRARGGQLVIFGCERAGVESGDGIEWITVPAADALVAPIINTVPLQLLSYEVALVKGTDVDKPRNLAKSVTVE